MLKIFKLLISIIVCQLAGIIGSFFTRASIDTWYTSITKPSFTPPDWLFAPAWIIIYFMMGFAAYLVWEKGLKNTLVRASLGVFLLQLILNSLWSIGFFGFRSPVAGLVIIIALWLAILWTIVKFLKISKIAAALLIPYIVWVSFAAMLNAAIVILNR